MSSVQQHAWTIAHAEYLALRNESDALATSHPGKDSAVDRYCEAMDRLIIQVDAPGLPEVLTKLDLIYERQDGFEQSAEYHEAVKRDVARLAEVSA